MSEKIKTYRVIYRPFPHDASSRAETLQDGFDERDVHDQFKARLDMPIGSTIVEIIEA